MQTVRWFALALAAASPPILAQTAGALSGHVVDRGTGEPLAGAVVVATGPSLLGEQRAVSDPRGDFLLPLLPPGPVDLDIQREGYQGLSEQGVRVPLGQERRLRIELFPESGAATFATVPQPSVLAQGAASVDTISREQLALLPYGRDRRTFDAALPSIPFVQPRLTIAGTPAAEHVVLVDGAPVNGASSPGTRPLLVDFIEELQVKRMGYRAEDGGGAGAIIQAATRMALDAPHGSVFTNVSPFEASRANGRDYALDFGAELGAPLVRDHASFHGGVAPIFVAPAGGPVERSYQLEGRLDLAANADQRLTLEALGDPGNQGSSSDLLARYAGAFAARALLVEAALSSHHDSFGPYPGDRLYGDLRVTGLLGPHALKTGVQVGSLDGLDTSVALFAQDTLRLPAGLLLDAGFRFEHDQPATSHVLPRLGLSWDWSGRGTSRAFASWGRTSNASALIASGGFPDAPARAVADQVAAGLESQVYRDVVAGLEYEHSLVNARRFDGVTAFVRKPFGENYLVSASYTLSRLRDPVASEDLPHAFKLDLAYLYEVDARTSVSLGALVRLLGSAGALYKEVDLRLSGSRRLGRDLLATLTLDAFNLANDQTALPGGGTPATLSLRAGAALSF